MSTAALGAVLEKLAGHAEADEAFAEALAFLAKTRLDVDDDPFAAPAEEVLTVARRMNASRIDARRRALVEGSLTTAGVVALVATMSDRRAVDRRRHRGTLLGVKVGNTTYHPTWQFDRRAGETRVSLPEILTALREVTADPMAAHQLMVAPQKGMGGRSIAEVFADGDVDTALTLIRLAGDQS
jgi:hypothetical protein